ncbi:UDP-galactopyranose mutase [Gemmata sp. JC673]|uniref:UDP-galactopyranose mutase n=1 Tax=Gemmata algarum TaxID=2975278 RepID=A0ABU5EZP0_9BACT|nr:UDP-galactopyranose mutase [Gemmata algarum]MDY3560781.1 UDP-galactopyranose mutase [Gemmata algarum]
MLDDVDLLVCGAGPVGCVVAERAASVLGWKVLVIDRRPHIAGNCHDSPATNGVLVHNYGPHYFRTDDENLLRYLSRFAEFAPAKYEVRSLVRDQLYPFPINLGTLEQFFGRKLDADSAEQLLAERRVPIADPTNSEEYVLSRVGRELYEVFYLHYTRKQWGVHPRDLDPQVCGRVPVRLNRDGRYVGHKFQVMPAGGFTKLFARMLKHPKIRTLLNCDFSEVRHLIHPRRATVYCGPVDAYFDNRLGKLPYRSLKFEFVPHAVAWRQPCVQINYPNDFTYTRSVEIKHVTGQRHAETVVSYETPCAEGEPFYPIPQPASAELYARYRALAEAETARNRVYFCGRLAQYRYFNTDEVIQEALACFQTIRRSAGAPASLSTAA